MTQAVTERENFGVPEGLWWRPERVEIRRLFRLLNLRDVAKTPEPVIVAAGEVAAVYNPLANEELFLEFAGLPASEHGILDFAGRYGLLAGQTAFVKSAIRDSKVVQGDRISDWLDGIRQVRTATELWIALSTGERKTLRQHVKWSRDSVLFVHGRRREVIAHEQHQAPHLFSRWKRGELEGPARAYLSGLVSRGLRAGGVHPTLDPATGRSQLRPHTLLGAIWLQLYLSVTGVKKLGTCQVCGEWMVMERSTKRAHARCAARVRQQRRRARLEVDNGKARAR